MTRWMDGALCAQTDPEAFFPLKREHARPARQVCKSCPVAVECLEYVLSQPEMVGIWAGTSYRQRRKMRHAA